MKLRMLATLAAVCALVPAWSPALVKPFVATGVGTVEMWPPHSIPLPCPLAEVYSLDPHLMAVTANSIEDSQGDYAGPAVAEGVWAVPDSCDGFGIEHGDVNSPADPGTFRGSVTPGIAIEGSFNGDYTRIDHVLTAHLTLTYRTGFAERTIPIFLVATGLSRSTTSAVITTVWTPTVL